MESIFNDLIDHGADVEMQNNRGQIPLHLAALHANLFLADLLLLRKADAQINAKDCFGNTPLFYAVKQKRIAIAALLLRNGADQHCSNRFGQKPIDMITNVLFRMQFEHRLKKQTGIA